MPIPFPEKSQYGGGGVEPFQSAIVPKEKRGEVPAIYIAQAPGSVVVLGKEESRVRNFAEFS